MLAYRDNYAETFADSVFSTDEHAPVNASGDEHASVSASGDEHAPVDASGDEHAPVNASGDDNSLQADVPGGESLQQLHSVWTQESYSGSEPINVYLQLSHVLGRSLLLQIS